MSGAGYRPITDTWILGRAKLLHGHKYYGAYPSGFVGRARALLGASTEQPVLHVCGGRVRSYPFTGVGDLDRTMDLDPTLEPDYLQDARDPYPTHDPEGRPWASILSDPPYTEGDALKYAPGVKVLPSPQKILLNGLRALEPGGRVGILHYLWPRPPAQVEGDPIRNVAAVSVLVGFSNRVRLYTVYERERRRDAPRRPRKASVVLRRISPGVYEPTQPRAPQGPPA